MARNSASILNRACTPMAMSILLLVACDQPVGTEANRLDDQLRGLLERDARGLAYYTLPESGELHKIPQDPNNPLSPQKVALGKLLFHETALAVNNVRPEGREMYSCSSCHVAEARFTPNLPQGIAEGGSGFGTAGEARTALPQYDSNLDNPDVQPIRVPSVLNGAYQELMMWNGQFGGVGGNVGTEDKWTPGTPLESNNLGLHGLETQAHAGLEVHRMLDIESSRVAGIGGYQQLFAEAFPGDPEPINRLNAAMAISAYERTVLANQASFQDWLRGEGSAITDQEKRGAILFFGEADCVACHTGPALNSMSFHALGLNDIDGSHDPSRVNLAPFGGSVPEETRLGRGGFTGREEDNYKFKTPQLYNLKDGPFYGHGGSFASVREVVEYKNAAVPENPNVPSARLAPEFRPMELTPTEIEDLVAFLENALYDPNLVRHVPTSLPSGNCFPSNDPQSRIDLGCTP